MSATKIDLLSGDDFSSPRAETSLALVPTGEPQPNNSGPVSQQNALVLFDMFSDGTSASSSVNTQITNTSGQPNPSSQPQSQQNIQSPISNGGLPSISPSQYEQALHPHPVINGQSVQQQQSLSPAYGTSLNHVKRHKFLLNHIYRAFAAFLYSSSFTDLFLI